MRPGTALAALAVMVAAAGCGSGGGERQAAGQLLFARDCGFCHSLTGRQSSTRQGGDLLRLHIGATAMLEFVREMPVRHHMSPAEVRAVARYVLAVERRGTR